MKYIWKIEKNSYGLETWIHLKDIDYIFVLSKQSDGALNRDCKFWNYMAEVIPSRIDLSAKSLDIIQ